MAQQKLVSEPGGMLSPNSGIAPTTVANTTSPSLPTSTSSSNQVGSLPTSFVSDGGPVSTSLSTSIGGTKTIPKVPVTGEGWTAPGATGRVASTNSFASQSAQKARSDLGQAIAGGVAAPRTSAPGQAQVPLTPRQPVVRDQSSPVNLPAGTDTQAWSERPTPAVSTITNPLPFGQDPETQGILQGLANWNYSTPYAQWTGPQTRDMMEALAVTHARTGATWDQLREKMALQGVQPIDMEPALRRAGILTDAERQQQQAGLAYWQNQPNEPTLRGPHPVVRRGRGGELGDLVDGSQVDGAGNVVDGNAVRPLTHKNNAFGQPLTLPDLPLSGQPAGKPSVYRPAGTEIKFDAFGNVISAPPRGMLR